MKGFDKALQKLIEGFAGFTDELREIADNLPDRDDGFGVGYDAGAGEEVDLGLDDGDDNENVVAINRGQPRDEIGDDTQITMRSGDLRKVIDAYRKMVRYARENHVPNQDERMKLHEHIRAVKHLIRKPRHKAA